MESLLVVINFLASAFFFGTPLLLGTTGEILNEKSGSLNLGVEGIMSVGSIGGYLAACSSNSLFVGILVSFLSGALCGLLYSFLTVTLKANQNVTGLAMTIFGLGLYQFIGQSLDSQGKFPQIPKQIENLFVETGIPGLRDIPLIGPLLFNFNVLVYVAIAIAIIVWIFMFRTKSGLKMRAVGENPGAADSVGVNVSAVRYTNIIAGCGIMGIGGLYMALAINGGLWNPSWVNGYGWIAVALVIFANWSSARAIGGSFLFGILLSLQSGSMLLANAFPNVLGWLSKVPVQVYQVLPYLITALVIIISSIIDRKGGAPSACGVNYYREDR